MLTELNAINSARTQYRAMFVTMARDLPHTWNLHKGSCNVVLLRDDATMNVELPVIVRHVESMTEQALVNALSTAIRQQA